MPPAEPLPLATGGEPLPEFAPWSVFGVPSDFFHVGASQPQRVDDLALGVWLSRGLLPVATAATLVVVAARFSAELLRGAAPSVTLLGLGRGDCAAPLLLAVLGVVTSAPGVRWPAAGEKLPLARGPQPPIVWYPPEGDGTCM